MCIVEQAEELAGGDLEVEAVYGEHAAVMLAEGACADGGCVRRRGVVHGAKILP
jgi:hypothetical protein